MEKVKKSLKKWKSDKKHRVPPSDFRFFSKIRRGDPMFFQLFPLFSRRRRFTPKCRRYHRTKSLRPVIVHVRTITMLSSARFRAVVDTQSFLNSKFGMPLVHLKIEKYRLERARPVGGVDLVLTDWTYTRKSTHRMKNRSCVWWFPDVSSVSLIRLRRPHALRGWF